ncbi:aminotransferase class I/II-fold pyridoxal phosphate-dependent enzyme [Candidatus Bipolaricaulota bacterium]|nr:aminotransferase class I/II-fold pyridoxal phosphate-dependent enzyme [Candidatus Bipolaricaulota bacterium]
MNIPILDLKRQYATIKDEIDAAILDVVASAQFVLGPHVKAFEEAAAAYCGVKHAIGVASGTDALLLSLKALDIGPGDRVILPSFTFFATAGVIHNVGATPVFCDIDPQTFNLDPTYLRHILTTDHGPRTCFKAIIPVHLYGQIADMDEINAIAAEFDLAVVEDAAQAIGAEYRGGMHRASLNKLNEPLEPRSSSLFTH